MFLCSTFGLWDLKITAFWFSVHFTHKLTCTASTSLQTLLLMWKKLTNHHSELKWSGCNRKCSPPSGPLVFSLFPLKTIHLNSSFTKAFSIFEVKLINHNPKSWQYNNAQNEDVSFANRAAIQPPLHFDHFNLANYILFMEHFSKPMLQSAARGKLAYITVISISAIN